MAEFDGFGSKALGFFKALKFHQSKDWFEANRALYENDVLDPMIALLEELTGRFVTRRIPLKADGKRSVFRLHRDVRFAKDKSPYKTHAGAVMTRSGDKKDDGLLYIHIDPEGCFVAAGFYRSEATSLARLRRAMQSDETAARKLVATLGKGGLAFETFDRLTRIPRGFEALKDGPLDGVIRLKSLIVEEKIPATAIRTHKLADMVEDFATRAMPLLKFGWEALE